MLFSTPPRSYEWISIGARNAHWRDRADTSALSRPLRDSPELAAQPDFNIIAVCPVEYSV